ncbi:MAG: hypothetical protein ACLFVI_08815 [Archaeoglobaceae archaeon]
METFTKAKEFVIDPDFPERRNKALKELEEELEKGNIDPPVVELLLGYNSLPYCFTLQSCYGHFVYGELTDTNIDPLPSNSPDTSVEYRITYLTICLQDNPMGHGLYQELNDLTQIDPDYIQLGSAEWFWRRCVNSYVLQIEPERHKYKDKAVIPMKEALHIEELRNRLFEELERILKEHQH